MEDIAPELYAQIQQKMRAKLSHAGDVTGLTKKIRRGKATQRDIARYADLAGQSASSALKEVLKLEVLPDNTLYWNIAQKTIGQTLEELYADVNTVAAIQQKSEDMKKGLKLGIKKGVAPDKRIKEVMDLAVAQTTQEGLDAALTEPVITAPRKFYDDFQMSNADLREKLGYDIIVKRRYDDKGLRSHTKYAEPCQWCLQREGVFSVQEAHSLGVFHRHDGCGCTIEYSTPEKTTIQTDWTRNEWTEL